MHLLSSTPDPALCWPVTHLDDIAPDPMKNPKRFGKPQSGTFGEHGIGSVAHSPGFAKMGFSTAKWRKLLF
jgi:hypothetical protein